MKKIFSKTSLIEELKSIRDLGWISNRRHGNDGGIGNTLEDLLGIDENNLPFPNAAEWELKSQKTNTSSLITLMHQEPSPRTLSLVPALLLKMYGWEHKEAGKKYPQNEMSFRATLNAVNNTDRGFGISVNHREEKVEVTFNSEAVSIRHNDWLRTVNDRVGLHQLNPQPYWGFNDIFHKAGTKLHNCFFVRADVRKVNGREEYYYREIFMLQGFSREKFIASIENGNVLVDFDARTGHNHGTKFRLRQNCMPDIYEQVTII